MAVIGPGRAGRARLAALAEHPDARAAAVVGREGAPSLESVLGDPEIDALIIATPNHLHASMARAALESGKHAAVEYPLAQNAREARELFALARARGRVLHVEHIELLSPGQAVQRVRAARLGRPGGGEIAFRAATQGWIADPMLAGSPALRALARLHRLQDLFGPSRAERARVEHTAADAYRLEIELRFRDGGHTRLVEERGSQLERALEWRVECERGLLDDPPAVSPRGLFRQDLDWFLDRVRSGSPGYVSEDRIVSALKTVESVEEVLRSG